MKRYAGILFTWFLILVHGNAIHIKGKFPTSDACMRAKDPALAKKIEEGKEESVRMYGCTTVIPEIQNGTLVIKGGTL